MRCTLSRRRHKIVIQKGHCNRGFKIFLHFWKPKKVFVDNWITFFIPNSVFGTEFMQTEFVEQFLHSNRYFYFGIQKISLARRYSLHHNTGLTTNRILTNCHADRIDSSVAIFTSISLLQRIHPGRLYWRGKVVRKNLSNMNFTCGLKSFLSYSRIAIMKNVTVLSEYLAGISCSPFCRKYEFL